MLKSYNRSVQLLLSNKLCCVTLLTAKTLFMKLKSHSVVITGITS